MKAFVLLPARSLAEAARETARPGTLLKAGGVDVLDRLKEGLDRPDRVVSIAHVPGHDTIEAGPPARIGALATLARLASDAGVRRLYPALSDAAEGAATPQIRNMATLGGNLCQRPRCWYYRLAEFDCRKKGGDTCFALSGENRFHAIFDTDLPCCCVHPSATGTALLAYGGTVETISPRGRRTIAIDEFFYRPVEDATRENVLGPGEIIHTITVASPGRAVYKKLKEKESFDWPIVETCANLKVAGGVVREARVVLGSVAPVPRRAREAEKVLIGSPASAALATRAAEAALRDAKPLSKNAYKVRVARVLLERTLREALA